MNNDRISLNKKQIQFLIEMLEIRDPQTAIEKFAELMILEGVDPMYISDVVNKIMNKMKLK